MAEATAVESAADAETQTRAEAMGWVPPARFKGDPERFIDADKFIERGETVLPIVKAQLAETRTNFEKLQKQNELTATALRQLQEQRAADDLRYAVERQKAVEVAIAETRAEIKKAAEAGDHAEVAALTEELVDQKADLKAATAAAEKPAPKVDDKPDASAEAATQLKLVQDWIADGNDWFKTDRIKQSMMQGAAMALREEGNKLEGVAFMNACKARMLKELGQDGPGADKVDSGRNGSASEERGAARAKTFNSLPAEAKAACKADAKQFVGPNKRYKTEAEWNAAYADLYFSTN